MSKYKFIVLWACVGLVLYYLLVPHYQLAVVNGMTVRLNTITGTCTVIQPDNLGRSILAE